MKKIIIVLMGVFIIVGEYTVLHGILSLFHLENNMYITYILFILMMLFNWYMLKVYDEETIKNHKEST